MDATCKDEKYQRRLKLRNEFLKKAHDPFRHMTGEGGGVFDPMIWRFQAMRVSYYEHFKPNLKNVKFGLFSFILPALIFGTLIRNSRHEREHQYRTGQVAYKDRRFKGM